MHTHQTSRWVTFKEAPEKDCGAGGGGAQRETETAHSANEADGLLNKRAGRANGQLTGKGAIRTRSIIEYISKGAIP